MAQVLAKADMGLAARYSELVEDEALRHRVFDKIVAEHDRTIEMLRLITGHDDLLADNPALARSVFNRFPYLEPLNHLQVELLRRFRAGDEDELVQRGILHHERARDGVAQRGTRSAAQDSAWSATHGSTAGAALAYGPPSLARCQLELNGSGDEFYRRLGEHFTAAQIIELGFTCASSMGLHRFLHTLDVYGDSPPVISYAPDQVDNAFTG